MKWKIEKSPKELGLEGGWFGELDKVYVDVDKTYCVMKRDIDTEWGKVTHTTIKSINGKELLWAEKHFIKNQLFGQDRTAIEIFPKEKHLVDAGDIYHLWIFDKGFNLPFGLAENKC